MKLTSLAFAEGEKIPAEYTCNGKNTHPELHIAGVPPAAKTLVLIMDDPDVPLSVRADRMWVHWILFNIPPETTLIKKEGTPPGEQGSNTSGDACYEGPCPPDREHRYFFKLYALDTKLQLPKGASKADVEQAMKGHILSETHLMGRYAQLTNN